MYQTFIGQLFAYCCKNFQKCGPPNDSPAHGPHRARPRGLWAARPVFISTPDPNWGLISPHTPSMEGYEPQEGQGAALLCKGIERSLGELGNRKGQRGGRGKEIIIIRS